MSRLNSLSQSAVRAMFASETPEALILLITITDPADPVFVIGLPRSGTTLLFNLLSLDKSHRSPLYWEIMHPFPIVKSSKEKIKREKKLKLIMMELK